MGQIVPSIICVQSVPVPTQAEPKLATTFALVSVVETTVPPAEFLMTRSALVISEAPNGSVTVKRTYAATPAGVVLSGVPPGNGAP